MNSTVNTIEQNPGLSPTGWASWKAYGVVAVVAAVIIFWRLPAPVMDDHECKLALTARVMADPHPQPWLLEGAIDGIGYEIPPYTEFNHWMVPVENGRPRLVKTPLPYWCAAGIGKAYAALGLPGPAINNLTARLTSALSAVALALLTLAVGRRMFPQAPRAAFYGALMLAACVGFQKWGRDARPEMLLCLLMNLAMACFYLGLQARTLRGRVGWVAAFWVAMGLANMAKEFVPLLLAWPLLAYLCWRETDARGDEGRSYRLLRIVLILTGAGLLAHLLVTSIPALQWWRRTGLEGSKGPYLTMAMMLGLPMLWYVFCSRGWRQAVSLLPTAVPGVVVMAALFVPWMWYMNHLFPSLTGHVFDEQVAERAAGTGTWKVAFPAVYLQALVVLSLPWIVFLPGALAAPLMRRFKEYRQPLTFLLLWSVGLVALFSAAAGKRPHYLLPMIPALCLLVGFIAEDVFHRHAWISPRLARWIGGGYGLAAAAAVAVLAALAIVKRDHAQFLWLMATAGGAAVLLIPAGLRAWRGQFRAALPLIALGTMLAYVGYYSGLPRWDDRRAIRDFATRAAARLGPDQPVYHWGDPQAKMVFYFGRPIPAAQWFFDREAYNLQRQGVSLDEATARRNNALLAWINQGNAPWIIGYEKSFNPKTRKIERREDAKDLEARGYRPYQPSEFQIQSNERGYDYLFTLYHRP